MNASHRRQASLIAVLCLAWTTMFCEWSNAAESDAELGGTSSGLVEPGKPKPGGATAVNDSPVTSGDKVTVSGPTSEHYRRVREAAFASIDKSLGIDSAAAVAEELRKVGATGTTSTSAPTPDKPSPNVPSVVAKLLNSDLLDILIDLLPLGNNLDLVKAIVAVVGKVAGGAESATVNALTEEDIKYMNAHARDIRKALEHAAKARTEGKESASPEAKMARIQMDGLIELERLRREHAEADVARAAREQRIRDLQNQTR